MNFRVTKRSVHEVHEHRNAEKCNLQTIERSFERGLFIDHVHNYDADHSQDFLPFLDAFQNPYKL